MFKTLALLGLSIWSASVVADNIQFIDYENDGFEEYDYFLNKPKKSLPKRTSYVNPDPYERINRKIYKFNKVMDRRVLKPVAKTYRKITPKAVRRGINNFFSNLGEPFVITNDLLQFKLKQATKDTARFLVNSTIGILGLFDVASKIRILEKHDEDFGQTFGKWGVPQGPYIILPFFGPSTVRDLAGDLAYIAAGNAAGITVDGKERYILVPVKNLKSGSHQLAVYGLKAVALREGLLTAEKTLETISLDEYASLRDAYLQRRKYLVYDGNPPEEDSHDEDCEETDDMLADDEALLNTP